MDIDGLGEKSIVEFIGLGWLRSPSDIFRLKARRDQLIGREGWQAVSVDKLLAAIEARTGFDPARFLFGLGIRHVGAVTAKDFCAPSALSRRLRRRRPARAPRPNCRRSRGSGRWSPKR